MCEKTIGTVSSMLVDGTEQPKKKPRKKKAKTNETQMNSVKEERLERLAREWVPHPTY